VEFGLRAYGHGYLSQLSNTVVWAPLGVCLERQVRRAFQGLTPPL